MFDRVRVNQTRIELKMPVEQAKLMRISTRLVDLKQGRDSKDRSKKDFMFICIYCSTHEFKLKSS